MKQKLTHWRHRTLTELEALRWSAADRFANAGRYQPLSLAETFAVRLVAGWPVPGRLSSVLMTAAAQARSALARVGTPAWPGAGMLIPQPRGVAVLVIDMRGFSKLTKWLDDPQYLSRIINEYLSAMTGIVERDHGIVFQYTGDGLLGLFIPELSRADPAALVENLASVTAPDMHRAFDEMLGRWRADWTRQGRENVEVGLGVGISYGRAALGLLGPDHKQYFGVIGAPVNLAAYLCSQARAGTVLVDSASFETAGATAPKAKTKRLRSEKLHQRIEVIEVRPEAIVAHTESGAA
jgi:class 3 adenylate cyclase